jgi:hypothetical protein
MEGHRIAPTVYNSSITKPINIEMVEIPDKNFRSLF